MSFGLGTEFGFHDDDVVGGASFHKRIDKSSPVRNPGRTGHEDEIDTIVSPRDPQ
jgi:hypothetical protein